MGRLWISMAIGCAVLLGCGDDDGGDEPVCEPGDFRACPCRDAEDGLRACLEDGSDFGACDCSGGQDEDPAPTTTPPVTTGDAGAMPMTGDTLPGPTTSEVHCGNGSCEESLGETCARCEEDCGACSECEDDAGACGFSCGNGECEPGEDPSCEDCAGLEDTCGSECSDDSDCVQPWTSCIGGGGSCIPTTCAGCFDNGEYCCWCNSVTCDGVSCAPNRNECPACP